MNTAGALGTAFLLGLLGSVHCFGMCGGIAGALTAGLEPRLRRSPGRLVRSLLAYHGGRVASYTLAGAIAGLAGAGVSVATAPTGFPVTALLSALLLIGIGSYLAGWWHGLAHLERGGALVWSRFLQPAARRLLPVRTTGGAFASGVLWGWLPCGLVYTALALAALRANALESALSMAAFGLGTAPLLAAGAAPAVMGRFARHRVTRGVLGVVLIVAGFGSLYLMSVQLATTLGGAHH